MKGRHETLSRFGELSALLDWLHDRNGYHEAKNAVLRSLVREAQNQANSESAMLCLMLALWPGLDAIRSRLYRHYRTAPDDLVSDLSAGFALAVGKLDLECVKWIAATLLRNLERDTMRTLKKRWRETAKWRGYLSDDDGVVTPPDFTMYDLARIISEEDAALVLAVAIGGYSQSEAAARFGISEAAGRKRYQRAMRRLRKFFEAECPEPPA